MYSLIEARRAMREVGLIEGLPPKELRSRLEIGNRLGDSGQGMLAFFLADMQLRGAHALLGHASAVKYAENQLDMDRRRAGELIRVGKRLRELPYLWQAFCEQRIGWSKVQELVKKVVPEEQETWLELAQRVPVRELKRQVQLAPEGGPPRRPGDTRGLPQSTTRVEVRLDALTAKMVERAREKLEAERGGSVPDADLLRIAADLILSTADDGTLPGRTRVDSSLFTIHLERVGDDGTLLVESDIGPLPFKGDGPVEGQIGACLDCDAEHIDADGEVVDQTTPTRLRKRVIRRDRHRCRCCGTHYEVHVHHIQFREDGGPTKAWNLITLCRRCHALAHAALLVLEGKHEKDVRFLDDQGAPLERVGGFVSPEALLPLLATERDGALVSTVPDEPAAEPQPRLSADEAFADVVGQDDVIRRLEVAAKGSEARGRPFPHTLLTGSPGTGKTTLARGIAATAGTRLLHRIGSAVSDKASMLEILGTLRDGDVLFLDEIHAVSPSILELLYDAMQEGPVPFTLLGATTKEGRLDHAMVSRFGLRVALGYYSPFELSRLARIRAEAEGKGMEASAAHLLAQHARGTPRELCRLVDRVLDVAAASGDERLREAHVIQTLALEGHDVEGLNPDEQRYMKLLQGGVCRSLGQLARRLGKDAASVQDHIEPFLLHRGLIEITGRGRVATLCEQPSRAPKSAERSAPRNPSGNARGPRHFGTVG